MGIRQLKKPHLSQTVNPIFNHLPRFIIVPLALISLVGCATSVQPRKVSQVRTTAYTHSEGDHIQYGRMSAAGTVLSSGHVRSAASDWSKFPVGTRFRVKQTGQVYQIDDYGSALVGTSTLDLYTPTRGEMNRWGVRFVDIEVLSWGSPEISLKILRPRSKHPHIRQMVRGLEKQSGRHVL